MSSQRTSRLIGPFLRWLIKDVSEETIYGVQYVVRKGAHLAEYALLAGLFWFAWRRTYPKPETLARAPSSGETPRPRRRPWSWSEAGVAFALAVLYALTDEFHQSFVPSRQGQPLDVLIDALGAAAGLMGLHRFGRWRHWW